MNSDITINGNRLTIRNVQVNDEGLYTCEGTSGNSQTRSYIRLIVIYRPQIDVSSNGNLFKVGQEAVLTCSVVGRPDLTQVLWRRTDGQILTSSRDVVPEP